MILARTASVYLIICVGSASASAPNASRGVVRAKKQKFSLTTTEARFVRAINRYRERFDLPLLEPDPILFRVARARVRYLDEQRPADDPTHNHRALGKWCWHHAQDEGFGGWATDNLAMGCPSPG
jgi:uncharacterized protein YkwD